MWLVIFYLITTIALHFYPKGKLKKIGVRRMLSTINPLLWRKSWHRGEPFLTARLSGLLSALVRRKMAALAQGLAELASRSR